MCKLLQKIQVLAGMFVMIPVYIQPFIGQCATEKTFFSCQVSVLSRMFLAKCLWPALNNRWQASLGLEQEHRTRKKAWTLSFESTF